MKLVTDEIGGTKSHKLPSCPEDVPEDFMENVPEDILEDAIKDPMEETIVSPIAGRISKKTKLDKSEDLQRKNLFEYTLYSKHKFPATG